LIYLFFFATKACSTFAAFFHTISNRLLLFFFLDLFAFQKPL
jgi:hypothetical protein